MRIEDKILTLDSDGLKEILYSIALYVENILDTDDSIKKLDLVEEFKNELKNQLWLIGLDNIDYDKIEIRL